MGFAVRILLCKSSGPDSSGGGERMVLRMVWGPPSIRGFPSGKVGRFSDEQETAREASTELVDEVDFKPRAPPPEENIRGA